MTLSELITKLEAAKKKHGDIEVYYRCRDSEELSYPRLHVRREPLIHYEGKRWQDHYWHLAPPGHQTPYPPRDYVVLD